MNNTYIYHYEYGIGISYILYIYIYMELYGYIQTLKSLNQSAEEENSLAMPPAVAITQDTSGERPEFYWCGMDLDYEHVGKA